MDLSQFKTLYQHKKILVFTNKNSFSLYQDYFEKDLTAELTYYRDFQINPKLKDVIKCIEQIKHQNYEVIVGIGGGSPMDFAKAIRYYLNFENSSYEDYLAHLKAPRTFKSNLPLILIPTTSGSGSEANCFSVIYDEEEKYSLATAAIYPSHSILDEKFVEFLPQKVTAYTAIDAITHALEAYWANDATVESQKISLQALDLLVPHIKEVVHHPSPELRKKIMQGAYLAGKAIDTAKTTAPHAFSYYLTTQHQIPHGQAVAINLGFFIECNATQKDLSKIYEVFQVADAPGLKSRWFELLKEIDIYLHPLEVVKDKTAFFDAVNTERLGNNPYPLKRAEFEGLFTADN
jgi:alcohol dehydrogenase